MTLFDANRCHIRHSVALCCEEVLVIGSCLCVNIVILSMSSIEDDDESADEFEGMVLEWYPRDSLRRTNWLYRVDALRPHDIREMEVLWDLCNAFRGYAVALLAVGASYRLALSRRGDDNVGTFAVRWDSRVEESRKRLVYFVSFGSSGSTL